jgi:hypothetical protein
LTLRHIAFLRLCSLKIDGLNVLRQGLDFFENGGTLKQMQRVQFFILEEGGGLGVSEMSAALNIQIGQALQ